MKIARIIFGTIIALAGIGLILFGASLLVQQQSWLMLGGFIVFLGLGYGIAELGYDIVRGNDVRDSLIFLLFLGGPR